MKIRQNVLAGLVKFETLTSGDVFRLNGEMWLAIITSSDDPDWNAALLKSGRATHFEADRLVHPIEGQFVEEGAK